MRSGRRLQLHVRGPYGPAQPVYMGWDLSGGVRATQTMLTMVNSSTIVAYGSPEDKIGSG
jgi:hypothetical protein